MPQGLASGLRIGWMHLGHTVRDPVAALFIFVLPLLIIVLIGAAIDGNRRTPVGVAGDSQASQVAAVMERAGLIDGLEVRPYPDRSALITALRKQDILLGLLVTQPEGPEGPLLFERWVGNEASVPIEGRAALDEFVAREDAVVRAAHFAATEADVPYARAAAEVSNVSRSGPAFTVASTSLGARAGFGVGYTAPANLVLFMFVNTMATSTGIAARRRLGIHHRMLATAVPPAGVVFGEVFGRFVVALFQAVVIIVASVVFFRVSWGNPIALVILLVLFGAVAAGAGMLLAAYAKSPEQVLMLAPPLGILMGMLGGCMWPLDIVAPSLRAFGHLFPPAWAMDALLDVRGGAGLTDIAIPLLVLVAFAGLLLATSARSFSRQLRNNGA